MRKTAKLPFFFFNHPTIVLLHIPLTCNHTQVITTYSSESKYLVTSTIDISQLCIIRHIKICNEIIVTQ